MKKPQIWYCQSETYPSLGYNFTTSNANDTWNRWPPGNWGMPTYPAFANKLTSINYYCRPQVNWNTAAPFTPLNPFLPPRLPRMSQLRSVAVLAEALDPNGTLRRHKDGMNVMYSNGSGHWVSYSAYKANSAIAYSAAWPYNSTYIYTPANGATKASGIWADLDRN